MKNYVWSAVLTITLGLGAAPAVADHYGSYAKPGYGAGKGKMPGYSHGHHRYGHDRYGKRHGMGYRKGHWGHPYRGYKKHHRHSYSRGGTYGHPYGHGKAMGSCHKHKHAKRYDGATGYDHSPAQDAYSQQSTTAATEPKSIAAAQPAETANIVETAIAADAFATLVSAVKAADLAETLSGEGPFTVFAPTDEAFNKLPEGTVPGLLNNTDALTKVLTYHVVAGRFDAADLIEQREFTTVNGAALSVDQLNVAKANVEASNGVIHIIDEVLLPPEG